MDAKEYELRQLIAAVEERLENRLNEVEETVEKLALNKAMQAARANMPNEQGKFSVKIGIPDSLKNSDKHQPYVRSTGELAMSIFVSFDWDSTPEGHDYWRTVMTKLAKLEIEEVPTSGEVNELVKRYA